jgi:hypothetical protein
MSTAQDYGDDDGDVEPSYGISSEVISTLAELWAAVGCRSMWTKPTDAERERLHQLAQDSKTERMRRARDAQQRAIDRHRTKPTAATTAGAASLYEEIVRVRDDFSHDTTALND